MGLPDSRDFIGLHASLAKLPLRKNWEQAVMRGRPDGMKRMFVLDNSFVGDVFKARQDVLLFPAQGVCHTRIFGWFVGQIAFCDNSQPPTAQPASGRSAPRYVGKGRFTLVANGAR